MSVTPARINLRVYQGSTFKETFRWESQTKGYVAISNISKTAPCIVTTTTNHNIPAGWRFRITDVVGMTQINQASEDDYYIATEVTNNTITINSVNSINFSNYGSGGTVSYNLPIPLENFSAVFQIRENISNTTVIKQLTSQANGGIVIDNTNKLITITISAADTTNFSFANAVYGLELTGLNNEIIPLLSGNVALIREVVR